MLTDKNPGIQQALEFSFNRNLVGKLERMNEANRAASKPAEAEAAAKSTGRRLDRDGSRATGDLILRPAAPDGDHLAQPRRSTMIRRPLVLLAFLALVVGGGLLIGLCTLPGPWYEALQKPSFNPPNWLFGPAWTVLYVLIAIAGWRVWLRDRAGSLMKLWWLQLVLNFLWSPVFFGMELIGPALVVVLACSR